MSSESTSLFPLVNPGKPSSLRRSHSVASESLPTPPSTIRKRPRTGSRSSVFSDEEDNGEEELPRPISPEPSKKKRRLDEAGKAVAIGGDETEEDEFWGPAKAEVKKRRMTAQNKRRSSTRSKSPLKVTETASRRAAASMLLSPPPTRPRAPVTPPRRTSSKDKEAVKEKDKGDIRPVRDSPNNPFLIALPADAAADSDVESDVEVPSSPLGPKTPLPELPTMTYVFRGKKQIFANPFYGAQPDPRATLSPRHPDYSPSEMCAPRRLFKPRGGSSSSKLVPQSDKEKRAVSPDQWDSEDEEGAGKPMPRLALVKEFAKARENGDVAEGSDDEAPAVDKRSASRSRSRSHHEEEDDDEATVGAPTSDTVAPEAQSDEEGESSPKAAKIARAGSSRASYKNGVVRSSSYVKKASFKSASRSRSHSIEEWTAEI